MKKISGWISSSKTKRALAAAALMTLTLGWLAAPGARAQQRQDGRVRARGAFTCDFALPGDFPFDRVAPVIERDRMYMAERPGMRRKQIPMRFDPSNGQLLTGGRYLFDTEADAAKYKAWVENDYVLDGTHFFDRPYFLNPVCHSWGVVAAYDLGDVQQQVVMRTERWAVPQGSQPRREPRQRARRLRPALRQRLLRRGRGHAELPRRLPPALVNDRGGAGPRLTLTSVEAA